MIVMIYLLQWSLQDNQHVHKRKLNEKNSSWVPLHLSAQVIERDLLNFSRYSEYGIAVGNKLSPISNAASWLILLVFFVLWFFFNCSFLSFRDNFFGNRRRNVELFVTGYFINHLTADCNMLIAREANGRWTLTPWANVCYSWTGLSLSSQLW